MLPHAGGALARGFAPVACTERTLDLTPEGDAAWSITTIESAAGGDQREMLSPKELCIDRYSQGHWVETALRPGVDEGDD